MKKVIIIGGMAAGCKTAARLRRLSSDYKITIIEKQDFVSFGACGMPFFAAGEVDMFLDLAKTPWGVVRDDKFFKNVKDIDVLTETIAVKINKEKKSVKCRNLKDDSEFVLDYDYLVIATGAKAVNPKFPVPVNDSVTTFHNPLDAKNFRMRAQQGMIGSAVIVGGGFIGVELAEALASMWGIETTLVEKENRLLPGVLDMELSGILERSLEDNGIKVMLSAAVRKVKETETGEQEVEINNTKISTDHVFICLGVKPETSLAEETGIELGESKAVSVNEYLQTNIVDIYSAGDCIEIPNLVTGRETKFPLGSLANRQGRVIANNIHGIESRFPGATGLISLGVFGMTVAATGLNEKGAEEEGLNYGYVCGSWFDRPEYHPEHKTLYAKMLYEKKSFRLLGLQLAGKGQVTRYVDSFGIFLSKGMNCHDLIDFEHAYTPVHSSPVNPLNDLGAMAVNQEITGIKCLSYLSHELDNYKQIIDVREEDETEDSAYNGDFINYPTGIIRQKLNEFDKTKPVLIVCQRGPRSYNVARIFKNKGFEEVAYLGGGVQLSNRILDLNEN